MAAPLVLPPGVDGDTFAAFVGRAAELVGADNVAVVSAGAADLEREAYAEPSRAHDMFHVVERERFVASAVVAPRRVGEVQAVLRLCNALRVPLWPFSMGRNLGYGGAAPRVPGSVGLDLGRHLNRVLAVDVPNACCLVEPGVTYQALYDHLVARGLDDKLWVDVPDLGGGSVLGNCLDRGVGYTPYGDHFMVG